MSFLDVIKKIFTSSDINFCFGGTQKIDNRIDNRKVIFENNNSQIRYGNEIITNPEIINKVFDEITKCKEEDKLPFQLVHKELEKDYYDYEEISIKEKESISLLKTVLPPEEVECILMARRVCLASKSTDEELRKELYLQLEKNYPKNGKKVLNLINENYFDQIIIPFIEMFKMEKGETTYVNAFRKFYEEILVFFPLAVFVNSFATVEWIKNEINKRLRLDIPFIRLHTIGDQNIKKVSEAISELKLKRNSQVNNFVTSSGMKAQTYEIRLND